ncbi:MAG: threonine-phosphate decarboxylase CobD, partial [Alphaproteobacteria bacterium]
WLDLSTGVNPHPFPFTNAQPETLTRLPDPAALADLLSAARIAYRAPASTALLATPGSEMAIRLLPSVILSTQPRRVAIVGPTYGSHEEAWRATGAPVDLVDSVAATQEAEVVVACNPNNPDGRTLARQDLINMAAGLAARDGMLVVDEAFADLDPDNSLIPHLDMTRALVLRSFGKFFGLPGLRLGFLAGPQELSERLGALLGDWPVSGAALAIGRQALADTLWQNQMRARLARDAEALVAMLEEHGLQSIGGTDLFHLVAHADAEALYEALATRGILTRLFPAIGRLRIGLPANGEEQQRLSVALAEIL